MCQHEPSTMIIAEDGFLCNKGKSKQNIGVNIWGILLTTVKQQTCITYLKEILAAW